MCRQGYLSLFFILWLTSCASKKPVEFDDTDNVKIAETFDLETDLLDKFKVEKSQESTKEENRAREPEKKKTQQNSKEIIRPKLAQKSEQKPAESRPTQKKTSETVIVDASEEGEDSDDELSLPSGDQTQYPSEFTKYDETSKKLWSTHRALYYPNEEKVFSIKYLGITAAHIRMSSKPLAKIAGQQVFHYVAQLKSASFYERIYKMDDKVESYISVENFLPVRYTLVQRETGQNVDDLQIFDRDEKKTFFWYKRDRKGELKKEEKEAYIPTFFQDTFSSIFFARGLPMVVGMKFEFPIVTRTKLWLLKMKVESVEEVRVMGEFVDAYRIEAETRLPSELSKKPSRMTIWVSADERKRLLKFSASVKFGSIEGILEDYRPGEKAYRADKSRVN